MSDLRANLSPVSELAIDLERNRGDDVADRGAPGDQLRAVVDHLIPDRPGGVVPAGAGSEDLAVEVGTANDGGELRCSSHAPRFLGIGSLDKVQFRG